MAEERFDEKKRKFIFQDDNGNLLKTVNLVAVEGVYDNQNHEFVDPPRVVYGYGILRPERHAEMVGCKLD